MAKGKGKGKNGNLIPLNQRSPEEQKAIRAKGTEASVKARKTNRNFRECLAAMLSEKVSPDSKLTRRQAIAMKVLTQLYNDPNMSDFKKFVEIMGELPGQTIQSSDNENLVKADDFLNIKLENE